MISLSTKYAIRALIELTKLEKDQLIQVQELSERIQIPQPYLAKVVKSLAQKGFVFSRRGIHGGVRLEKKAFQANFYEICVELKDPIVREACFLSKKACNSRSPCEFHSDWAKVRTNALGFLKRSRLKE